MMELYEYIACECNRCPMCSEDGMCNSHDIAKDCMTVMEVHNGKGDPEKVR
jgi:hypothetical protein